MDKQTVPYLVYESSQTRLDKIIHRLIIALVVTVVLLFISNVVWAYVWWHGSTDAVSVSTTDGVTTFIGNDNNGEISN